MATGDCTLSINVEGGVTKTVSIDSATRGLALAYEREMTSGNGDPVTDAEWQSVMVNYLATRIVANANKQQNKAATPTPKTFTAAT